MIQFYVHDKTTLIFSFGFEVILSRRWFFFKIILQYDESLNLRKGKKKSSKVTNSNFIKTLLCNYLFLGNIGSWIKEGKKGFGYNGTFFITKIIKSLKTRRNDSKPIMCDKKKKKKSIFFVFGINMYKMTAWLWRNVFAGKKLRDGNA